MVVHDRHTVEEQPVINEHCLSTSVGNAQRPSAGHLWLSVSSSCLGVAAAATDGSDTILMMIDQADIPLLDVSNQSIDPSK